MLNFAYNKNKEAAMKKIAILSLCGVMLLGACTTYTGTGAYAGATLGSVVGSAIGGIAGGPRGSDIGTLVGMAGGAAVGGAIGAQADKKEQERRDYEDRRFERKYREHRAAATRGNDSYYGGDDAYYDGGDERYGGDESGFDPTNSGDDVLYDFQGSDYTGNYTAATPEDVTPEVRYDGLPRARQQPAVPLEVRGARFVDDNQDRSLNAGELSKVIFEVYNISQEPVYDVQPIVVETTGNKHVGISSTVHVERIVPGKGVRYTAMVKAGKRLKDGELAFRVYAVTGNHDVASNVSELKIRSRKN